MHEWNFSDQESQKLVDTITLLKTHSVILFSFSKSHLHCSCHLPRYTHKITLSVCVRALLQARCFGRPWFKSVILVNISCIYSNYYVTPAPINSPVWQYQELGEECGWSQVESHKTRCWMRFSKCNWKVASETWESWEQIKQRFIMMTELLWKYKWKGVKE